MNVKYKFFKIYTSFFFSAVIYSVAVGVIMSVNKFVFGKIPNGKVRDILFSLGFQIKMCLLSVIVINFTFLETTGPISSKVGKKYHWVKDIQF